MAKITRLLVAVLALAQAGPLQIALASSHVAECAAFIDGTPVGQGTIEVSQDDEVVVSAIAPAGAADNNVFLKILGKRWEVAGVPGNGAWSDEINVDRYADWGVGLYELVWESRSAAGELLCESSASLKIDGSPLSTVAGVVGAASVAVGLTALTFTLRTTINEGARWAIKLVGSGKLERDAERGRLRLKPKLSVRQTLLGTLWGVLLGAGSLASLQEAALSLPTIELALELVLPLALLGLLAGTFRLSRDRGPA